MQFRNITQIVFAVLLGLSLISAFVVLKGDMYMALLLISVALNIVALVRSDRGGIVRKAEARRAYEPARAFNGAQVLVLVLLSMMQAGLGVYVALT